MSKPYKIDIAVLLIFFARPDHFSKVFEVVKNARPSKLYLYQDGPRSGREDDKKNIAECRQIAENIDWECEVHTFYQEENVGCDPSEYISIKWMFEAEEMGIILEDDDVPSQSFFLFCKELLEKYKGDTRIYCISGMNHLDEYRSDYADYIFTRNQCISGWATWKRCIDGWDKNLSFLDSDYILNQMDMSFAGMKQTIKTCSRHRESGKEYYESIGWAYQNSNHMLNIVPTKNLISNIGLGANGTHGAGSVQELPKVIQNIFNKEVSELQFPLRHPDFIIEDMEYLRKVNYIQGIGHPVLLLYRAVIAACRRFWYADADKKKEKILRLPRTISKLLRS